MLQKSVDVELVEKRLRLTNYDQGRFSNEVEFPFMFTNTSSRKIRTVTGNAVFSDIFGREIVAISLLQTEGLLANAQAVWEGVWDFNQFMYGHTQVAYGAIEDMIFTFDVKSIVFADGVQMGSVR
jgi:hypothetical protein